MEQKKFIILALALVVVLVLAGAGYKHKMHPVLQNLLLLPWSVFLKR